MLNYCLRVLIAAFAFRLLGLLGIICLDYWCLVVCDVVWLLVSILIVLRLSYTFGLCVAIWILNFECLFDLLYIWLCICGLLWGDFLVVVVLSCLSGVVTSFT